MNVEETLARFWANARTSRLFQPRYSLGPMVLAHVDRCFALHCESPRAAAFMPDARKNGLITPNPKFSVQRVSCPACASAIHPHRTARTAVFRWRARLDLVGW
jgi:hypothetical protein